MSLLKSLAAVSSMTMFSRVLCLHQTQLSPESLAQGWQLTPFSSLLNFLTCYAVSLPKGHFPRHLYRFCGQNRVKTPRGLCYVSGLLTLALAVVHGCCTLAAPWVIMVTAPGFADTADKFALTSQLLKITFPYILLISLALLVGAICNTRTASRSGVCSNTA